MAEAFDFIVIGGGSGGLAAARRAASIGNKVLIIEAKKLGGTCVNVGCIPKKVLWNGSNILEEIKVASDYAITVSDAQLNFTEFQARIRRQVGVLNETFRGHLARENVTFVEGWASFVNATTVQVGEVQYSAPKILISTGSKAIKLEIPGSENLVDSDYIFYMQELPRRIALIGNGYIATEMAGILAQLGAEVTMVIRFDRLVQRFDLDIAKILEHQLRAAGVNILYNSEITAVNRQENGELQCPLSTGNELTFDCVLAAIGRNANVEGLGLESVGIQLTEWGYIPTDQNEETTVPGIYSIGDCAGKVLLTPVAVAAGRTLAERLFNNRSDLVMDYSDIPTVMFAHPPIGMIGMSEEFAREQYGD